MTLEHLAQTLLEVAADAGGAAPKALALDDAARGSAQRMVRIGVAMAEGAQPVGGLL